MAYVWQRACDRRRANGVCGERLCWERQLKRRGSQGADGYTGVPHRCRLSLVINTPLLILLCLCCGYVTMNSRSSSPVTSGRPGAQVLPITGRIYPAPISELSRALVPCCLLHSAMMKHRGGLHFSIFLPPPLTLFLSPPLFRYLSPSLPTSPSHSPSAEGR
jgi:hypothetical protein